MPVTKQLVENLARLPTELALEIINDLRAWDVIKLMLRDNPRIDDCLLANADCRDLLGDDAETLNKTRIQVKEYLEFAEHWKLDLQLPHEPYYLWSLCHQRWKSECDRGVVHTLHIHIWQNIAGLPTYMDELLRPYIIRWDGLPKVTIYSSLESYKQYWQAMAEAKGQLVRKCYDQLWKVATLLEKNSDILKRTTDPSQKPRPNIQHIVSRMKQTAGELVRSRARKFRTVEYFRYEFFPIVPFDWALERLFYMMEKHNMATVNRILDDGQHPPAMTDLVRTVVGDLRIFYLLEQSPPMNIPYLVPFCITRVMGDNCRRDNLRWSKVLEVKEKGEGKVVDTAGESQDMGRYLSQWRRTEVIARHRPHRPELEGWLIAFVEVYRYFEKLENEQEEWN